MWRDSSTARIFTLAIFLWGGVQSPGFGEQGEQAEVPLFDGHIHYSENTWEVLSPSQAVATLRRAGVIRALVSSSSDEGTQRLYDHAPDLVIPSLRPYRDMAHQWDWVADRAVIPYLEYRLRRYRYAAIGEFHVDGVDADLPNIRAIVKLARQYGLFLHAHSDADAIARMFSHDPTITILWAHVGFEPPEVVDDMMRRYPRLWGELSMRGTEIAAAESLESRWRQLLIQYADRFLVGSDTYVPDQWMVLHSDATATRSWLRALPPVVARKIAFTNGETLIAEHYRRED